jgi:hypothetical protein
MEAEEHETNLAESVSAVVAGSIADGGAAVHRL